MPGTDHNSKSSIRLICLIGLIGLIRPSLVKANSLSVSPTYQYVMAIQNATDAASIKTAYVHYTNHSQQPISLEFSLAHIQATDMLGRLQFNAPLPQSILPAVNDTAVIKPAQFALEPNRTATVSVMFNPNKIEPGKTAFLLLGKVDKTHTTNEKNKSSTEVMQYVASTLIVRDPTSMHPRLVFQRLTNRLFPIQFQLPDFFRMAVKNSGTAPTIPRGLMRITDQFNREIMRGPINEDSATVLAGSERIIYSRLQSSQKAFPISFSTLHLSVYDDEKIGVTNQQYRFVYIHPFTVIGLIGLIGLISLIGRIRHMRHI